jgi:hypothetical protein
MKKIGIITVSRTYNFGAELQAYALQKKLQLLGYNAEIIDYLYYKHKNYKQTSGSKPLVQFSPKEQLKKYLLYRIATPILDDFVSLFSKSIRNRLQNFESFHLSHVRFSNQYRSLTELNNAPHPYDVFIVGSDQVWNPATGTSLSPYFLEFAPKDKLRMSYASSFGVSSMDVKYHEAYKRYFSNLESIAVREEDGVALVKQISDREATRVLDPTLLLTKDEWCNVIDKPQPLPEKYVLIYMLHDTDAIINWAYHLKQKCGLQIVMICKRAFANKKYPDIINIEDAGPSQFIELFSKASFVVTNSFHGTAFSVNFNVPFVTVLKKEKANNSRMLNFLNLVGLGNRIVWEDVAPERIFGEDWIFSDFSNSNNCLSYEKENSIKYLLDKIK